MTIHYVANQTFGGGIDVGAAQAGLQIVAKLEQHGGFGTPIVEANRHVLGKGYDWKAESTNPGNWTVHRDAVVLANPPCSGFSLMSNRNFRGTGSSINSCMIEAVEYAAACDAPVFVMESVQQAFWTGLPLMEELVSIFEERTGRKMHATHLLHDAFMTGSCQTRKRYLLVISREPFYVGHTPRPDWAPNTLNDAIIDLESQQYSWDAQPYASEPTTAKQKRERRDAVDGHAWRSTPHYDRLCEVLESLNMDWPPNVGEAGIVTAYYDANGVLPPFWARREWKFTPEGEDTVRQKNTNYLPGFGFNQMMRWRGDTPSRVITGGSTALAIHPTVMRPFTHRECARIMGFPDDYVIRPTANHSQMNAWWGKQVTVDVGRWISSHIVANLETGKQLGDDVERWSINDRAVVIDESRGSKGFDVKKFSKQFGYQPVVDTSTK